MYTTTLSPFATLNVCLNTPATASTWSSSSAYVTVRAQTMTTLTDTLKERASKAASSDTLDALAQRPIPSWALGAADVKIIFVDLDSVTPARSAAPWQIYNVGNSRPVELMEVVALIERAVGRPALREFFPLQPGDVIESCADSADLERAVGFRPNTPIEEGTRRFVDWFRAYHRSAGIAP